jgi:hypothetical protein
MLFYRICGTGVVEDILDKNDFFEKRKQIFGLFQIRVNGAHDRGTLSIPLRLYPIVKKHAEFENI